MDKYRIDIFPASYYLDQFKVENITVLPYREAGFYIIEEDTFKKVDSSYKGNAYSLPEQLPQGTITICYGNDDLNFDICFPVKNGIIDEKYIALAGEILAELPALDSKARELSSKHNYEEYLAYITIEESETELHYFATTVNTEWGAYFEKQADGTWAFEGLG